MALPSPTGKSKIHISRRTPEKENLTAQELKKFMDKHGMSEKEFSELLGVTIQAVTLWLTGKREFSTTNSRLIKMFEKHPSLIRQF